MKIENKMVGPEFVWVLSLSNDFQKYFHAIGFFSEQSNWQKVQLNTDLLKRGHEYLYRKLIAWLKRNEIRSVIKLGNLISRERSRKVVKEVFAVKCFYKSYKNLIQTPKYLGVHLAPSSHCSILIDIPLSDKAGWENDLSIAPIKLRIIQRTQKFDQHRSYQQDWWTFSVAPSTVNENSNYVLLHWQTNIPNPGRSLPVNCSFYWNTLAYYRHKMFCSTSPRTCPSHIWRETRIFALLRIWFQRPGVLRCWPGQQW